MRSAATLGRYDDSAGIGFVAKFLEEATHAIKSRLSVNLG
jgi:hypothetical protein